MYYREMMNFIWMVLASTMFGSVSSQRLPSKILPIHYNITLLPVLDNPRLCGHVSIDFKATESVNVIEMHASDIQILDASAESLPAEVGADPLIRTEESCFGGVSPIFTGHSGVIHFTVSEERQMVALVFSQPLAKDRIYRITIDYLAQVSDDIRGFFRQSYVPEGQCDQRWIGGTLMEPTFARRVFPCFDEPQYKATFQFAVGHHRSNRAISNTPQTSSVAMRKARDWQWSRFETTPVMSTYLLAVVVSDYVYMERRYQVCQRSVTMRFWSRPEHASRLLFIVELAPKMLRFLEKYFRMPFALAKIDFISLPGIDQFTAMENWGLIVFNEEGFHLDQAIASELERVTVATNLAHELSHSWFGNLVTFRWWNDVWFTEGFTTYFSDLIIRAVLPEFEAVIDEQWTKGFIQVLNVDISEQDGIHPTSYDPKDPNDVIHLFDVITYQKAAILVKMVSSMVGDDTLRRGLTRFMKRYQYQNANCSQFWEVLTEEIQQKASNFTDLEIVMDSWLHRVGYPIVQCYRTNQTGQFMLTQKSFDGEQYSTEAASQAESAWWIPISATSMSGDANPPLLWSTPNQRTVSVSLPIDGDAWILINPKLTGYYRVEYDEENWRLLADQLVADYSVFSATTRMKLVDDAFHLAWTQIIPMTIPFQMIKYLRLVQDDQVRRTALNYVTDFKKYYPSAVPDMDEYIWMLAKGVVKDGRSHKISEEKLRSPEAYGQLYRSLIDASISDSDNKFVLEHFEKVWCAAIRRGSEKEWDFAWSNIDSAVYGAAKVVRSMACSNNETHLRQLLVRMLHPDIKQSADVTSAIITSLVDNPISRSMTIEFLVTNWPLLSRHFGRSAMKELTAINQRLCCSADRNRVRRFIEQKTIVNSESLT